MQVSVCLCVSRFLPAWFDMLKQVRPGILASCAVLAAALVLLLVHQVNAVHVFGWSLVVFHCSTPSILIMQS